MINPFHFRLNIVKYSLFHVGLWSQEAEDLLCGTALVESRLSEMLQIPGGYAKSFFQIEEPTYEYLASHCLKTRPELYEKICDFLFLKNLPEDSNYLIGNMFAACLIARLKYLFNPEPIPKGVKKQAEYWNRVYNTRISEFHQRRYVDVYEKVYGKETT